jgi:restriction system protein
MPSQYPYRRTIRNNYLGVNKVIKAMTAAELDWLVEVQLAKWKEQESRKRQKDQQAHDREAARRHAENLKEQAEGDTTAAQETLAAFQGILTTGIRRNLSVDWDQLSDRRTFEPFESNEPKPDLESIRLQLLGSRPQEKRIPVPRKEEPSALEWVLPFLRTRRLARESEARERYEEKLARADREHEHELAAYHGREKEVIAAYNAAAVTYNAKRKIAKERYRRDWDAFLAAKEAHNKTILDFRRRYEAGSAEAVERYMQMVLERSSYPDPISLDPDVRFDEATKTLVVNCWLPEPALIPKVVEHKFVASRKEIKPVEMKPKEFEAYYDDVIHQVALRTVHEVFTADHGLTSEAVVFNGWVRRVDRKTGTPFTSCVLSVEVSAKRFAELDLANVSPKECVRGLKGITAGPLVMLAPVKPVMELIRDDDRFVESKEVLDGIRPEANLAAMEWEDFEHLVRELFEKEFSKSGGEVRVTQASRDRGVDAIAFDPDPIRGGKFVIQAKRYNMVVPVSAVRDLYGTMISDGAVKGILVTTSYFGKDSREFAQEKPISLIDGENLVHMFQKYGHDVHIALLPKGDPRRGLGVG